MRNFGQWKDRKKINIHVPQKKAVEDPQLLGFYEVSIRLTLRRLMSYIYIYIYIYIYMEHPFLMFLDHTQRRSTFGRTPLDE